MTSQRMQRFWRRVAFLTVGTTLFLGDCDPTLRATVEDGIIGTSSALIGSLVRAFINVALEAATV